MRRKLAFVTVGIVVLAFAGKTYGDSQLGSAASCTSLNAPISCTASWQNGFNAKTPDDQYAEAAVASSACTKFLRCASYGFGLPVGAAVNGIVVHVERKASTASAIKDHTVQLLKNGQPSGDDKADISTTWPTTDTPRVMGTAPISGA